MAKVNLVGMVLFCVAATAAWLRWMATWPWAAVITVAVIGAVLMAIGGGMERWERRQVRKINRQLAGARLQ